MSPLDVPEDGDYIIGRVIEVKDFGATLDLLEYTDQKAFVHISEVASGWVKYIRDFIREGQMVVAKVTKVKKGSKIIDASVRQVSGHRKKEKIRKNTVIVKYLTWFFSAIKFKYLLIFFEFSSSKILEVL